MIRGLAMLILLGTSVSACAQVPEKTAGIEANPLVNPNPASDSTNRGGWVLQNELSDEFNLGEIDESKWFVQGKDGQYMHWKGRAPSQFAAHNVRVEDGNLKLMTRWEPGFDFADEKDKKGTQYGDPIAPVTTAAVVSKNRFLYGYMETRSKAINASMTSAFWTLGYQSELDIFEQMGNPKKKGNYQENHYTSAIHDWRPDRHETFHTRNKTFENTYEMDSRVADAFHVYGCEWGENYLKFYLDGKLVHEVTKAEIDPGWVLNNPLEIWFDSEIFNWLGYPHEEELPGDFEIDYVRVWQKPDSELLDKAVYGFEGPMTQGDFPLRQRMKPPIKSGGSVWKHWNFDKQNGNFFKPSVERSATGIKSLKLAHMGPLEKKQIAALAPDGSVALEPGEYKLSMKIWIEPGSDLKKLHMGLSEPRQALRPVGLEPLKRGEWVEVSQRFKRKEASGKKDRLGLFVLDSSTTGAPFILYIDDISVKPAAKK